MPFIPKKPAGIVFTNHARAKMRFYGLSEARVKRVLHSPKRIEEGIAPGTIAMLQSAGSVKHPYEIWTMVVRKNQNAKIKNQNDNSKFKNFNEAATTKVISAWKYPGITKPGQPLPEAILQEFWEAI